MSERSSDPLKVSHVTDLEPDATLTAPASTPDVNSRLVSTQTVGPANTDTTVQPTDRSEPAWTFGRYHVQGLLGKGGMGEVFLAQDTVLHRTVALKIPKLAENLPSQRERFFREARSAARLSHPNICPVYDVGEIDGRPYLTMAYIDGPSLAQLLRERGPFACRDAARLLLPVAHAMQHAHQQGILHRDLKPGNILLNARGEPSVMDFGLAFRFDAQTSERLTQQGLVVGTPAYMSPEQINGQALGPAADVYSLGVVLYELLTGQVPFEAPVGKLLALIHSAAPPQPRRLRPDVDPILAAICLKALAKRPAERFAGMAVFAQALDDYLQGKASRTDFEPAKGWRIRKRWWVAAAVAAVVLGVAVAWMTGLLRHRPSHVEAAPAAPVPPEPKAPAGASSEPVVDPKQAALERLFAHVAKPILKIEYPLHPSKPTRVARDRVPAGVLKDPPGPLYFILSGDGNGHVVDMTDQPGQGGQLQRFDGGEITILGPYLLFLADIGDKARVYIQGGPAISLLAPMSARTGGKHIEFDGTHFLLARFSPRRWPLPMPATWKRLPCATRS
jgi:predicted Ser/Thr protein kinase